MKKLRNILRKYLPLKMGLFLINKLNLQNNIKQLYYLHLYFKEYYDNVCELECAIINNPLTRK